MTKDHHPDSWTWRAPDQGADDAGLLYEPGNWGDALKGSWALVVLRSLLEPAVPRPLRYLDVCAGAPTYPLSGAAARRMDRMGGGTFYEAQAAFRERRRLASTGLLVHDGCASAGVEHELQVFDADPDRRDKWERLVKVRVLSVSSGEDALAPDVADFILVDPYDFFDHWGRWLPRAVEAARSALVLIYLYDKSPRGPGFIDQYRRLRAQLHSAVGGGAGAVRGRIASDAVRPRAYHEVVLLGPAERVEPLRSALAAETRALARAVADDGELEVIGGDSDKV